jgi:predicted nucleotidyltransferase
MNVVRCIRVVAGLLSVAVGCGGSPKPAAAPTSTTSAELADDGAAGDKTKTAAEAWAEKKAASEAKDAKAKKGAREELDPLSMNSDVESSAIPKIEMTPAKERHAHSRRDFDAAVSVVGSASSLDGAAKKLTARLGKPTWTENGQRRIWVAPVSGSSDKCHRLVLDADGSVQVDVASKKEWRGLSALAQQNPCTGEIKRGISGT